MSRPHFLVGGILFYQLGAAIAHYSGARIDIAALTLGQAAVTAAQLMTHFCNDYFDLNFDRANLTPTPWSGGSRVLVEGRLSRRAALIGALGAAAVSLAATAVLSVWIKPGLTTLALLFTSIAFAWFYSAPPLRLHSRGLGELTAAILVTGLTPLTGFYLQTGIVEAGALAAILPLCCLQFAMLLSVEFPDAHGDELSGKRTLVVRLGSVRASRLYTTVLCAPYALMSLFVALGLPPAPAVGLWALFPLAGWLVWRAYRGDFRDPLRWSRFAFFTIALLVLSGGAELIGFVVG